MEAAGFFKTDALDYET